MSSLLAREIAYIRSSYRRSAAPQSTHAACALWDRSVELHDLEPTMPIRLSNIRLSIDEPELALSEHAAGLLDVQPQEIERWRILRKSLDARDKSNISYVYSLEVAAGDPGAEPQLVRRAGRHSKAITAELYESPRFEMPPSGTEPLGERPVIVGSGPAGVFAAYFLAEQGYRPLVLERGKPVRERIRDMQVFDEGGPHNPESNYLFGEGGAGTFSDGKLTCRSSGPDVQRVLEIFAECKGKPSILYDHRPHLGSNRLPAVVKAIRERIIEMGGEFQFDCRVEDLELNGNQLRAPARLPPDAFRPRSPCWPSATALATRTRCCTPAGCRWCTSRFSLACASSNRRSR